MIFFLALVYLDPEGSSLSPYLRHFHQEHGRIILEEQIAISKLESGAVGNHLHLDIQRRIGSNKHLTIGVCDM